jgi:hypothetical protein
VPSVVVRTLARELSLHTDSDKALAALSYIGADPVVANVTLAPVDLTVEQFGSFFRVALPGRPPVEGSIETIINRLFRLLGEWLPEEACGSPILHAAVARIEGRRFVFLGDKGFGKTTLMLGLIAQGIPVEGDEHIVVTQAGAIARPRRLHVKETSLEMFPALRDGISSSPSETDWMGNRVYACAPSSWGTRWEIADGAIDHIVFVEPNFGGSSILSPIALDEAFARLLETTFMPPAQRGLAAVRLRKLCVEARKWRLQAGNLDQALRHLRIVAKLGT